MLARISIIIPTYNRRDRLGALLHSLANGDLSPLHEVLICDDGSTEDVSPLIAAYTPTLPLHRLAQKHSGFRAAAARNMGIRKATGDILLFLDDDLIVPPHFLITHASSHKIPRTGAIVIGLRHRVPPTTPIGTAPECPQNINDHRASIIHSGAETDFAWETHPWYFAYTCNLSISGDIRNLLFDERFVGWGNEDLEYAYRAWSQGAKISCNRDAWVMHVDENGPCRDPFRAFDLGQPADFTPFLSNCDLFSAKHPNDPGVQRVLTAARQEALEKERVLTGLAADNTQKP